MKFFSLLILAPLALGGWHHPPKPSSMSPSPSPTPSSSRPPPSSSPPPSSRPPPSSSVSPTPSVSPKPPRPPRSFRIHLRGQNCCVNAKGTNVCDEVELAACNRASRWTWYGDRLQLVGVHDRCLAISRENRVIVAGCAPSNDPRIKSIAWSYNAWKGVLCSEWICLGTKTHWWRRNDPESRALEIEELSERDEAEAADAADAGAEPESGADLGVNGDNTTPGGEGEKPSGFRWPVCPRLRTVWKRNAACFDFDYRIWW